MKILFEDEYILVVHKDAGLATQTAKLGEKDLYSEAMNYLKSKNEKTYIGIINRLDQPVAGIVLLSKNEKITAKFTSIMQNGSMEKYYIARTYGVPIPDKGLLADYMRKDPKSNRSVICNKTDKDSKKAQLEYEVIEKNQESALISIKLLTGRHHQIRVQMSNLGCPLIGDTKYGTEESIRFSKEQHVSSVALLAKKLIFPHPATKKVIEIVDDADV